MKETFSPLKLATLYAGLSPNVDRGRRWHGVVSLRRMENQRRRILV